MMLTVYKLKLFFKEIKSFDLIKNQFHNTIVVKTTTKLWLIQPIRFYSVSLKFLKQFSCECFVLFECVYKISIFVQFPVLIYLN